ncbi:MAG: IS66 family transposase [Elusimicrobia bacterium]|nr:IS66 family transposase [Elusimicrobiota bacterium]
MSKRNRQLEKQVKALAEEVARLREENRRLKARVSELEERLGQNSRNTSKPPSSDPPSLPPPPPKTGSGRKPGGQPGHTGHQRELVPEADVDEVIPVKPTQCRDCGAALHGEDPAPRRHQVAEIPQVKPRISEYQLHALICGHCSAVTIADLPPGVPSGAFGPRAVATVSLLTSFYRLGRRAAVEAMQDLFGLRMSLGSVPACERIASAVLAEPVSEAQAYVKEQAIKQADETSWFEGASRTRVWLWVAFTQQVTVFLIRASRGTDIAKELLGQTLGVLVTDRWCGYTWWPLRWRQLCWAHLKRHFQAFVDAGGKAGRIGQALLVEEKLLFEWWHRVRDGTLARSTFRVYTVALRRRVKALLRRGSACGHGKTQATCRELLKLEPAMWTFVRLAGVSPTNNASERAIRRGVIWRKLCFGTHSEAGSRFAERMLTVTATLRQQGRGVVDYVTSSIEASLRGERPQSLLPTAAKAA